MATPTRLSNGAVSAGAFSDNAGNELVAIAPVKASGAEITTGTNDTKFATPKAIADAAIVATPVKASGAEINTGTDDAKFVTAKAIRDSKVAQGVAAAYKIARGEHTQVAASDTVVTGLATVISIVVSPRNRTVKQLFFNASPGDQTGTPAAGSVLITSQKPTAVNDVTPIAATDFTDNIVVDWIAVGT